MRIIKSDCEDFDRALTKLDSRFSSGPADVERTVRQIVERVRRDGDRALLGYTEKFDGLTCGAKFLRVTTARMEKAKRDSDPKIVRQLEKSARRIKKFHKNQIEKSWSYKENGTKLGQLIRPIGSVGIYVPGGLASYPSSALMNAIPAKIAGVKRIVMVTPTPAGKLNPHILIAGKIAGVDEIYTVGGAQAVAALAYGTKTIAPVDKIVGPGNAYVAEAKRQVFGKVGIDMIAGPSEILILADDSADPKFAAADLLSQAEHDENAYPILVTTSNRLAESVAGELRNMTARIERAAIVKKCLGKNCFAFVVKNLDDAFTLANRFAPEHLELIVKGGGSKYLNRIKNAGAVFLGQWTPEALGDYSAGPNHVLPTGGCARFFSPLGVYDFLKRTSLVSFDRKGMTELADCVITLARAEGLTAHARAVEVRLKK